MYLYAHTHKPFSMEVLRGQKYQNKDILQIHMYMYTYACIYVYSFCIFYCTHTPWRQNTEPLVPSGMLFLVPLGNFEDYICKDTKSSALLCRRAIMQKLQHWFSWNVSILVRMSTWEWNLYNKANFLYQTCCIWKVIFYWIQELMSWKDTK